MPFVRSARGDTKAWGFRGRLGEKVAWLKPSESFGRRDDWRGESEADDEEEEARGDLRAALII